MPRLPATASPQPPPSPRAPNSTDSSACSSRGQRSEGTRTRRGRGWLPSAGSRAEPAPPRAFPASRAPAALGSRPRHSSLCSAVTAASSGLPLTPTLTPSAHTERRLRGTLSPPPGGQPFGAGCIFGGHLSPRSQGRLPVGVHGVPGATQRGGSRRPCMAGLCSQPAERSQRPEGSRPQVARPAGGGQRRPRAEGSRASPLLSASPSPGRLLPPATQAVMTPTGTSPCAGPALAMVRTCVHTC